MSLPNHIYIISNGSTDVFPENSLTKFSNLLPSTFEIDRNDNIRISVESIGFSAQFSNILTPDDKNTPSILITNHVTHCSREIPGSCSVSAKNTQEELDNCAKCLEWMLDEEHCVINEYFIKNQYYSEQDIKDLCKKINNENSVKFTYKDHTLSIEHAHKNLDKVYLFLHPTFIQTFNLPKQSGLTPEGYKELPTSDPAMKTVLMKHFYNKSATYKSQFYYGYRLLNALFMKPLKGGKCDSLKRKLPKIVRVQSSIIASQILNGSHSKDLVVFCTDFQNVDTYYYQEFLQPQKVKLQNTTLNQIDLSLRDEEGRKLQLVTGAPTILKLKLENMDTNVKSFNVRLTSATNNLYPRNQKSNFKVKLPNTLYFNEKWKVALTSITHPNIYNTFTGVRGSIKNSFFFQYDNKPVKAVFLGKKIYSANDLIDILNEEVVQATRSFQFMTVDYQPETKKIRLYPLYDCEIGIGQNLLDVLGYDGLTSEYDYTIIKLVRGQYYNFQKEMDLNALQPNLMIAYCNIVKPTIFSSANLNVLRVLSTPEKKGGVILQEFQNKHFVELANTEISEIDINFRSPDGELVEFSGDKDIILNLEFSNVE